MLDILQYAVVALIIYFILDFIWTLLVAKPLYEREVGEYVREKPNYFASILVMIFFSLGLAFFVIEPAITDTNIVFAMLAGLFFGFVASTFYALSNIAIFKKWSLPLALIDITWISFLSAATSAFTYLIFA